MAGIAGAVRRTKGVVPRMSQASALAEDAAHWCVAGGLQPHDALAKVSVGFAPQVARLARLLFQARAMGLVLHARGER